MVNLWNFILFQGNWFALVLGAAHGLPWLGVALAVVVLIYHYSRVARPGEGYLLLVAGGLGWLWESLLHVGGLMSHPGWSAAWLMAPPWMGLLWMNFATTLHHSLGWLKGRPWLSALLGAAGGPLAFWGGQQLGAIHFSNDALALGVLAVAWALLTPAVVALAEFTERRRDPEVLYE